MGQKSQGNVWKQWSVCRLDSASNLVVEMYIHNLRLVPTASLSAKDGSLREQRRGDSGLQGDTNARSAGLFRKTIDYGW